MRHRGLAWTLLGVLFVWLGAGCAAPDAENRSARPWNSPEGWEHGVPAGMMEGR
ncbi:MAG: hypothetical protein H7A45_16250 [Verrucomicrobiales bacterium]|nr:hypothetical protein [Verrucomicrobiales bacterium]MCP5527953.1 hypothetical protein [Verrucomicrobiales bacterium]